MRSVSLRCSRCIRSFRVLEDEMFDHCCPYCNFGDPAHAGVDYFGNEIVAGDEIVITDDNEVVLKDDLERFLTEVYGFEFTEAE